MEWASFKADHTIDICSQQPGTLSIQPFCIDMLISLESKRNKHGINSIFIKQSDPLDMQVRREEGKVTGFIVKHNVPVAVADHLGPLFKHIFPESKIAKNYICDNAKTAYLYLE